MNKTNFLLLLILFLSLSLLTACKQQIFDTSLTTTELEKNNISLQRYENLDGMLFKKIGGRGFDWGPVILPKGNHFLLAGSTYGTFRNSTDFIISKVDQFSVQESYIFGGGQQDLLEDAVALKNGGVLLFGQSQSYFFTFFDSPSPIRPLVVKLDSELNLEFAREYNPFFLQFDCLYETQAEELVFGGSLLPQETKQTRKNKKIEITPSLLVKTDQGGNPLFAVKFNVGSDSQVKKILNDGSTNLVLFGNVFEPNSASKNASYVAKVDQNFNAKEAYFLQNPSWNVQIMDVERVRDSYVVLASYYQVLGVQGQKIQRDTRIALISLNKNLEIEWAYEYKSDQSIMAFQVFDDQRGNIVLSGLVGDSEEAKNAGLVLFLNSKGTLKNAAIITAQSRDLFAGTFLTSPTGSYVSYGGTAAQGKDADFLILKYDTPTHFRDQEQAKITATSIKINRTALTLSPEKCEISSTKLHKERVVYPIVAK